MTCMSFSTVTAPNATNECLIDHGVFSGLHADTNGVLLPSADPSANPTLQTLSDAYFGEQVNSCQSRMPHRFVEIPGVTVSRQEMGRLREAFHSGGPAGNTMNRVVYCLDVDRAGTPGFNLLQQSVAHAGIERLMEGCATFLEGPEAASRCATLLATLRREYTSAFPTDRSLDVQPALGTPNSCDSPGMQRIPGIVFSQQDLQRLRTRLNLRPTGLMADATSPQSGQACINAWNQRLIQWMIERLHESNGCPVSQNQCNEVVRTLESAQIERRNYITEGAFLGLIFFLLPHYGPRIISYLTAATSGGALLRTLQSLTRNTNSLFHQWPQIGTPPLEPDWLNDDDNDEPPTTGTRNGGTREIEFQEDAEDHIVEAVGDGDGAGVRVIHGSFEPLPPAPSQATPASIPTMPNYSELEHNGFSWLVAGVATFLLARRLSVIPLPRAGSLMRPLPSGI